MEPEGAQRAYLCEVKYNFTSGSNGVWKRAYSAEGVPSTEGSLWRVAHSLEGAHSAEGAPSLQGDFMKGINIMVGFM